MRLRYKFALLASASLAIAPAAFAQDAAHPDSGGPDSGGIAEIIVTAQKRAESTQRIPMTIEAISADDIGTAGVDDLISAQNLTPGVVFSRAPDGGVQLTFRGLGTPARNASFEQSVGGFQDGVFYGSPVMYLLPFFDVERLEFIKGTQSALLGKNTSVGAVSVISQRPGDKFSFNGKVSREFELGGWTAEAGADLPVTNTLSVRIAGYFKDQNGWIRNEVTNNTALAEKSAAGRIVAKWHPDSGIEATAIYQYVDAKKSGSPLEVVTDDGVFQGLAGPTYEARLNGRTSQFTSFGPKNEAVVDSQNHLAALIIDVPVGDNTLTSQTSYSDLKSLSVNAVAVPGQEMLTERNTQKYDQFSQELRFSSATGGTVEYILGLYYFHSGLAINGEQFWTTPVFSPAPGVDLLNGNWLNDFRQKLNSYSAFGNATFRLSDKARISGSLRLTDETKRVTFGRTIVGPPTFWNTVSNPPFAPTPLKFADSFLNGNINFQYDVARNVMLYASYGRGTKTGGFADSASIPDANPAVSGRIRSETTDTFEAGIKSSLFDRRVILNLAGFYTKVKDYQVTYFDGASGAFVNLNAPARSQGFEAKFQARIADGLDIDGSATYADAVDRSTGLDLVSAPKWTLDGGISHKLPVGSSLILSTALRGHYRSSMYSQFGEGAKLDSFGTVNANVSVGPEDDSWNVFLRAANLFDANGADFGLDGVVDPRLSGLNANPGFRIKNPSRTVELGASVRF